MENVELQFGSNRSKAAMEDMQMSGKKKHGAKYVNHESIICEIQYEIIK